VVCIEEAPELQPVAPFEVGVGAGLGRRRQLVEVGAGGGGGVDGPGHAARGGRRRRQRPERLGRIGAGGDRHGEEDGCAERGDGKNTAKGHEELLEEGSGRTRPQIGPGITMDPPMGRPWHRDEMAEDVTLETIDRSAFAR
jgi:hypothetical protein